MRADSTSYSAFYRTGNQIKRSLLSQCCSDSSPFGENPAGRGSERRASARHRQEPKPRAVEGGSLGRSRRDPATNRRHRNTCVKCRPGSLTESGIETKPCAQVPALLGGGWPVQGSHLLFLHMQQAPCLWALTGGRHMAHGTWPPHGRTAVCCLGQQQSDSPTQVCPRQAAAHCGQCQDMKKWGP